MALRNRFRLPRVAPHADKQTRTLADRIDGVFRQIESILADFRVTAAETVPWLGVSNPPTTLEGYGITDAASDAELAAHAEDETGVHGIPDTSLLETQAGAATKVADSMSAHLAASDPHPQYLTPAEGSAAFDPLGAASTAVSAHAAAGDPHPQYLTPAEGAAAYDALGAATSALAAHTGAADPHAQYQLESALLAAVHALLTAGVNVTITNAGGKITISAPSALTSSSLLDATKLTGSLHPDRLAGGYYEMESLIVADCTVTGSLGLAGLLVDGPSQMNGDVAVEGLVNIGSSAWNGYHLVMGAYHLWVDAAGKLRMKPGAPLSATDGTVVGTQA